MSSTPRQRFTLELVDVSQPGDAPAVVRLRRVLKSLLRAFAFKCVRTVETTPRREEHDEHRPR